MWNRAPLIRTLKTLLLFIFLEGVSVVLISNNSVFQRVKINSVFIQIKGAISGAVTDIRYYNNLRNVNETLLQENLFLRQRAEILESALSKADTSYKEDIMDMTDSISPSFTYIPAKILSNSTNKLQNYLILDKGYKDGIEADMGVISPLGVVGIVSSVSANFSYAISFLNLSQSVDARLLKSGAFGPLKWEGRRSYQAVLSEIPLHIDIQPGDTVVTSGYSSLFPPKIPLGTAINSQIVGGASRRVQVTLFQDFKTLRFVNIVKNNRKEELEYLTEDNEQ